MPPNETQQAATETTQAAATGDTSQTTATTTVVETKAPDVTQTAASTTEVAKVTETPGAPEKYEFKAPEGQTLDKEVTTAFEAAAKELNLPQDKAQLVIDKMLPAFQAKAAAQVAQVKADLLAASKADAEFGGEKLEASIASAKTVIGALFTPAFGKFLNETGLGNHPEMIRGLLKMAPHVSEDGFVVGSKGPAEGSAQSWFPNSNMNK